MFVPDIMSHPKGKIVDEIELLFKDYDEEAMGSFFFEKYTDDQLPYYYRYEELILLMSNTEFTHEKVLERLNAFGDTRNAKNKIARAFKIEN